MAPQQPFPITTAQKKLSAINCPAGVCLVIGGLGLVGLLLIGSVVLSEAYPAIEAREISSAARHWVAGE